ncbi:hypothetical protein NKR23_g4933 [Pleurostoma richardsiae]|uniref:Uncharacterized protein n=1 Tax=Pleurostoma richardsiae TaxID=41990 RepID=A0AA38RGX7_9PEZI|nr:hypothetical protein NKR23_g4933 [Pleurostoma richardsiae]
MGKASNAIIKFIIEIPDEKLVNISEPNPAYTLWKTLDFRLDVQNRTSGDPTFYNIQVQVNKGTSISTLKKMDQKSKKNGTSVAKALVPTDGSWDAAAVREALLKGRIV